MILRWFFLLIFVSLIVAISGCTGPDTPPEPTNVAVSASPAPTILAPAEVFPVHEQRTVYVKIMGTKFDPRELEITNGTTVKWSNLDSVDYIINVSGSPSPILKKKNDWSFTFNETGVYEYRCDLHPLMPHGRITVI